MRNRAILLPIVIILVVVAAILLALTAWTDFSSGIAIFIYALLITGILLVIFGLWYKRNAYILVDEMDAAVIFYKGTNNFAYFIDSKPSGPVAPDRPYNLHNSRKLNQRLHKKDPFHHYINPFTERVESRASKRPLSVEGTVHQIRTREGVSVNITYSVGYNLDVTLIRPKIEYKIARAIPNYHSNMIRGRVIHSLRYMIEQKSVSELYTTDAIKKLEVELRHEVTKRAQGLGFQDIAQTDVKLGPIQVPHDVEKAIEEAHERELQTETAVKALEQIKRAINEYEDKDIERLAELERLRILDQHGGTLSYEMSNLRKTIEKNKTRRTIKDNNNPN
ncbi:MAG: hypothetical protein IAF02_21585 [Anaerolineae bacterium]|nr:hypothetical protein [Anaerolineae bacterium]